jgi:uncharacterized protein YndB with AHSA1/START domain
MPEIRAVSSAVIPAPPAIVYGLIADYQRGHPTILPPKYFQNLIVEEGGFGTGTRISFQMRSFGTVRHVQGHVTEPEPGRRLLETYPDSGIATEFTVDPVAGAQNSRVTIATRYWKSGLRGWLERFLVPVFLRTVYVAELRLLAEQARAAQSRGAPA